MKGVFTSIRCVCPGCSLACAAVAMKNPAAAQSHRLVGLLEAALVREARLWKVPVFKNGCIQVRRLFCTSENWLCTVSWFSTKESEHLYSCRCPSKNQRFSPLTTQGADISSSQHREMILWLGEMSRLFQFLPETFALGVCVLNRLLSTVKVRLLCVSRYKVQVLVQCKDEIRLVSLVGRSLKKGNLLMYLILIIID